MASRQRPYNNASIICNIYCNNIEFLVGIDGTGIFRFCFSSKALLAVIFFSESFRVAIRHGVEESEDYDLCDRAEDLEASLSHSR
ncbi:hypothetical protein MRB53_022193 [Persea americana]|uniref:Uncharacterized protein n=1 Tax=Persea americana TaxID=3435 RepID=A0ACC2L697_PERAE|nr:hypothetical protein MRB53_022193 [Persea americana]